MSLLLVTYLRKICRCQDVQGLPSFVSADAPRDGRSKRETGTAAPRSRNRRPKESMVLTQSDLPVNYSDLHSNANTWLYHLTRSRGLVSSLSLSTDQSMHMSLPGNMEADDDESANEAIYDSRKGTEWPRCCDVGANGGRPKITGAYIILYADSGLVNSFNRRNSTSSNATFFGHDERDTG